MIADAPFASLIVTLLRVNLVAAIAVAVVLTLRVPMRHAFGPHYAHALWATLPLAVLGALMPIDWAEGPAGPVEMAGRAANAWVGADQRWAWLLTVWLVGVAVSAGLGLLRQARFRAAERAGLAGPAAVGFVQPRLVAPADFAERFTPDEWRLVRAHERAHIDRLDGRHTALAAVAQWLFWFNPLLHLAMPALRLDQELACDATVVERLPGDRRRYAQTLLRTQLDTVEPLFGAAWRAPGSLEARLSMLAARRPSLKRLDHGFLLLLTLWTLTFTTAWAVQPPYRWTAAPRWVGVAPAPHIWPLD